MRLWRVLLALGMVVSVGRAAEIHLLKGDPIKGDIVSVTNTEVVYKADGKELKRPIKDVLKIEYREVGRPAQGASYAQVTLTDGSVLLASKWLLKKKEVELKLLAGPTVKLPVSTVAHVLNAAAAETNRREWKTRIYNTRGKEAIVVDNKGVITNLECTLGDGDETGTSITIAVTLGGETLTRKRELEKLHGIIFKHTLGAKAPMATCKLFDTLQDVVMVSSITPREGGLVVTTPAGAKIDFDSGQIARLDYATGKLDFLSEMEAKIVARSNLDEKVDPEQWHVFKDVNLNKGPLTLGGVVYRNGLAVKPFAELTYDLRGEYMQFKAMVGIDDNVSAAGATILVIEGDGKELTSVKISSADKVRHQEISLNVKDVQKLRIIVKADGEFDTSRHLDLADAKVSK